jgi:protein required for attachment to host cells
LVADEGHGKGRIMKNWMVVANSARARVLEAADDGHSYAHVADLVHPQSRQKGGELGSDRAGHADGAGHGPASAQFMPRTDARDREHERFAHQVAELVNAGVADGRCAGLVLVASNPFLGQLKASLSKPASKLVLRTLSSDFTTLSDAELAERVGAPETLP